MVLAILPKRDLVQILDLVVHITSLFSVNAEIKADPGSAGPAPSHERPSKTHWETQLTCHHSNSVSLGLLPLVTAPRLKSSSDTYITGSSLTKIKTCRIYCADG